MLISLGPLKLISTRFVARVRPEEAELAIQLAPNGEASRVLTAIEQYGGQVSHVEFGDERTVDVTLRASRRAESARVAEEVNKLDDVERVQWRP